jgi:hypothetical protein
MVKHVYFIVQTFILPVYQPLLQYHSLRKWYGYSPCRTCTIPEKNFGEPAGSAARFENGFILKDPEPPKIRLSRSREIVVRENESSCTV